MMRQKLKLPSKLSAEAMRSGAPPKRKPRRRWASAVEAHTRRATSATPPMIRRAAVDRRMVGTCPVYAKKGTGYPGTGYRVPGTGYQVPGTGRSYWSARRGRNLALGLIGGPHMVRRLAVVAMACA